MDWQAWKFVGCDEYITSDEDAKWKKALLLHFMGEQAYDIYDTLKADGDNYADVKQKLHGYFVPKVNLEYEKYVFS